MIVAPDGNLWVIDWGRTLHRATLSGDAAMTYLLFALESSEQGGAVHPTVL